MTGVSRHRRRSSPTPRGDRRLHLDRALREPRRTRQDYVSLVLSRRGSGCTVARTPATPKCASKGPRRNLSRLSPSARGRHPKSCVFDSQAGKNRGRQKFQMSPDLNIYPQMAVMQVISSDLSSKHQIYDMPCRPDVKPPSLGEISKTNPPSDYRLVYPSKSELWLYPLRVSKTDTNLNRFVVILACSKITNVDTISQPSTCNR